MITPYHPVDLNALRYVTRLGPAFPEIRNVEETLNMDLLCAFPIVHATSIIAIMALLSILQSTRLPFKGIDAFSQRVYH